MCETKLYPIRWCILATLVLLQILTAFTFATGQVNNVYVEYYGIHYTAVDWMISGVYLGSILITPILIWGTGKGIFKFRRLLIMSSATISLCFLLNGIASLNRDWFTLAVLGQVMIGVAIVIQDSLQGVFAVQWFPDNQVGTAIGVTVMGFPLGNIVGSCLYNKLLEAAPRNASFHFPENQTFVEDFWVTTDKRSFMGIFFTCFAVGLLIFLFVCFFVDDIPPLPPTKAQAIKREKDRDESGNDGKLNVIERTKTLFRDKAYTLMTILYSLVLGMFSVEFAFLGEIMRSMGNGIPQYVTADAWSGFLIITFSAGSLIGSFSAAKVIDKTDKYTLLIKSASLGAFFASLGLFVGYSLKILPIMFASNFVFGFSARVCIVSIFEMITQQTFPMEETFVVTWIIVIEGFTGMAIVEFGRLMMICLGPYGVMGTISCGLLFGVVIAWTMKPDYKRLAAKNGILQGDFNEGSNLIQ